MFYYNGHKTGLDYLNLFNPSKLGAIPNLGSGDSINKIVLTQSGEAVITQDGHDVIRQ